MHPDVGRDLALAGDRRADYDIKQARNFMIDLIGGEVAEQLRE
jgi:hypothetical protein